MEENAKLENVKNITRTTEIILKVAEIIGVIGACILICMGILLAFKMPAVVHLGDDSGKGHLEIKQHVSVFEFSVLEIDDTELFEEILKNSHSDIPFIQKKLDEGDASILVGIMLLVFGIVLAISMVAVRFLRKIFEKINKAGTPFAPEVIKQMKVSFIVISVALLLTTGSLIGVFAVFGLWSIYFIFQYGYCLQELADETI